MTQKGVSECLFVVSAIITGVFLMIGIPLAVSGETWSIRTAGQCIIGVGIGLGVIGLIILIIYRCTKHSQKPQTDIESPG